jgi:hypothetical protein
MRQLILVVGISVGASSCGLLKATVDAPGKVTQAVVGGDHKQAPRMEIAEQQSEFLRFIDRAVIELHQAHSELQAAAGTPEASLQVAQWRLKTSRALIGYASSSSPAMGLLDAIVALTSLRVAHERYYLPVVWHELDRPLLETAQRLENDAWALAERVLGTASAQQAREPVDAWVSGLDPQATLEQLKSPPFSELAKGFDSGKKEEGGGLSAMLSLDPLTGIEPATREVAQTRLLVERMLFYLRHAALLVEDQVAVNALVLRSQPEVVQLLADTERATAAANSIAETARTLPATLSAEISAQRLGLVEDLKTAQEPLEKLLTESHATLEAGTVLSTELTSTIRALDDFMARFDKPPPEPGAAPPPERDPNAPPPKPFDIAEYGVAATQLGDAARELTALVAQLDQSLPQVEQMVDVAATRGEASVDHAFRRGLQLGLVMIAAAAVALLIVRKLSARR